MGLRVSEGLRDGIQPQIVSLHGSPKATMAPKAGGFFCGQPPREVNRELIIVPRDIPINCHDVVSSNTVVIITAENDVLRHISQSFSSTSALIYSIS
jgi:hypothetical protein